MKTAEIRERFLRFFEGKGHTRAPSSPLVLADDPTLMFANSGMAQFKDVFLGYDKRPYKTAVTAQRCLRAGGKHNDLENVGYTARHHTFFEMLGNFSFGDYFKELAIPYAWEFLTSPQWLGMEKEHLWITVFGGGKLFGEEGDAVPADDEAAAIWKQTLVAAGFSAEEAERRICKIHTADNFWMMGETGPCGPCSEIFYDKQKTAKRFRGEDEEFADECVEVWNLVFMQYNRDDSGALRKLPAPCVDTGMGLERVGAVMQNVASNYETDLFAALLQEVGAQAGAPAAAQTPGARVVADHLRACAFLIADGVLPSNEGRGYVLRRIARRALRHLHKIRQNPNATFAALVPTLARLMGDAHPPVRNKQSEIIAALQAEEAGFAALLKNGMALLEEEIAATKAAGGKLLPGKAVFKLYDTYGFPPDMTAAAAKDDHNMGMDEAGFEKEMAAQRKRSRSANKFNVAQKTADYAGAASEFVGYDSLQCEARVEAIFIDGEPAKEARPGQEAQVVLNRTPFYAEMGGQVGDAGVVACGDARFVVADTQKIRADVWAHMGRVEGGALAVGDAALCEVDSARRFAIARSHSAAHLLHAALRRVLGRHVEQRGSQVSPKAARFDFSHPAAVKPQELRQIEAMVNEQIAANAQTQTRVMSYDDALKTGAMALFGEKYGERVRVVTIDDSFSVELCGGTHVDRAGDIGFFMFTAESAIAAGIRRVEAVCAAAAVERAQTAAARLTGLAAELKTPTDALEDKIAALRGELKTAQRQIDDLRAAQTAAQTAALRGKAKQQNGRAVLAEFVSGANGKQLRDMAMQIVAALPPPAAVLLAGDADGKAAFVSATLANANLKGADLAGANLSSANLTEANLSGANLTGADLSAATLDAREWLAQATAVAGGKGGGKAGFAQAGGGDAAKIPAALQAAVAALNKP